MRPVLREQRRLWKWSDGGKKREVVQQLTNIGARRSWSTCAKEIGEYSRRISTSARKAVIFQIRCATGKSQTCRSVCSRSSNKWDMLIRLPFNVLRYLSPYSLATSSVSQLLVRAKQLPFSSPSWSTLQSFRGSTNLNGAATTALTRSFLHLPVSWPSRLRPKHSSSLGP